jgi:polyhydroxyalkanoate synthesis regulator phasin
MKRKVILITAAALAVTGAGGAIAATKDWSPQEESKAVIDDVAGQLGVSSEKLTDALKQALENRVDAAVAAGRLTKEEGDALKAKIAQGDAPLAFGPFFGGKHHGHHGFFFGDLSAAATYLGLSEDALRTQLESGKTLAQVAQAQSKSVDDLVTALTDAAKKKLDAAVAAGNLTQAQADQIAGDIKERITDLVNGTRPEGPPRGLHGFGFRSGDGPPAGFAGPI